MGISLTIMAHGNGLAAFRRHLPLWQKHEASHHLVIVPEDDPIDPSETEWPIARIAKAQHNGPESLIRLRWLLEHLSKMKDVSHHLIFEYDSFCLSPEVTLQKGLIGNLHANQYPTRFIAPRYPNPPWIIDHDSVKIMLEMSKKWPDVFEEGETDRWFSVMAWLGCVPILEHSPRGFSRCWITEADINELRGEIYRGATMIHGIKQKWTLEAALQFYDERPR